MGPALVDSNLVPRTKQVFCVVETTWPLPLALRNNAQTPTGRRGDERLLAAHGNAQLPVTI